MSKLFKILKHTSLRFFKDEQEHDGFLVARVRKNKFSPWEVLWEIPVKNIVTNLGLAQSALLLGDGTAIAFTQGRIGTGTGTAGAGDTALVTQVDSQTAVFSREQTLVANDTCKWVSTHTAPGGGWSITEYGLFNSGNVMYNHVFFTAIGLEEGNQLEFTYKSQQKRPA